MDCVQLYFTNDFANTYIHNWSLQPFTVRVIALVSHTTYVTYSLKSTPNDRFLRNFSWQFYLLLEFLPEICWEEIAEEILFVWCLACDPTPRRLHEYCILKRQLPLTCRRNAYLWRHPTNNSPTVLNRSSEVAKRQQLCGW